MYKKIENFTKHVRFMIYVQMKPIHFYTMIDDMLAGILRDFLFKNKIDDVLDFLFIQLFEVQSRYLEIRLSLSICGVNWDSVWSSWREFESKRILIESFLKSQIMS